LSTAGGKNRSWKRWKKDPGGILYSGKGERGGLPYLWGETKKHFLKTPNIEGTTEGKVTSWSQEAKSSKKQLREEIIDLKEGKGKKERGETFRCYKKCGVLGRFVGGNKRTEGGEVEKKGRTKKKGGVILQPEGRAL